MIKSIRSFFRKFKAISIVTLVFWQGETIFFLIKDGWHWAPIDPLEKVADRISSIGFMIAFVLLIVCMIKVVELICSCFEDKM